MTDYQQQFKQLSNKLDKALQHLEYSWQKVQGLSFNVTELTEDQLATWESFSARFARVAELFLSRYLRTFSLLQDPGFQGSLRDYLNNAEKYELVKDVKHWLSIRELRNITAHDYTDTDLANYFQRLLQETPFLMETVKHVLQRSTGNN